MINSKNNDDECFQCSIAVASNLKQIKSHTERISNITLLLINIIEKR